MNFEGHFTQTLF